MQLISNQNVYRVMSHPATFTRVTQNPWRIQTHQKLKMRQLLDSVVLHLCLFKWLVSATGNTPFRVSSSMLAPTPPPSQRPLDECIANHATECANKANEGYPGPGIASGQVLKCLNKKFLSANRPTRPMGDLRYLCVQFYPRCRISGGLFKESSEDRQLNTLPRKRR